MTEVFIFMKNGISVIKKTIMLMGYLSERNEPSGISEIAKSLGMPKATVHRILSALCEDNVVLRTEDGQYKIGPTVLMWSSGYHFLSGVSEIALPWLKDLRDQSRETVHLSVYEHGTAQYAERLDSPQTVVLRWSRLGTTLPLYCTAAGRAILAALPEEESNLYFEKTEIKARTEQTTILPAKLKEMLSMFRIQGYAEEKGENEENIRCVGAAILNRRGYPVAAISLTAPSFRFSDADSAKFGKIVAQMSREISACI